MRKLLLIFSTLVLLLSLPNTIAHADSGPKPVMAFILVYSTPSVSVKDAQLYFCESEACASPELVSGPFHCSDTKCQYNYGGQAFYKLVITFDDKVRESNVFEKRGFISNFQVDVNENNLYVEQTNISLPYDISVRFGSFVGALIITLAIELPLAGFFLKKWNLPRKWRTLLYVNLITLPFVWFFFPFVFPETVMVIGFGEIFAFLAEAFLYTLAFQKDGMTRRQAITLSLIANAGSFLIPLCLLFVFFGVISM